MEMSCEINFTSKDLCTITISYISNKYTHKLNHNVHVINPRSSRIDNVIKSYISIYLTISISVSKTKSLYAYKYES